MPILSHLHSSHSLVSYRSRMGGVSRKGRFFDSRSANKFVQQIAKIFKRSFDRVITAISRFRRSTDYRFESPPEPLKISSSISINRYNKTRRRNEKNSAKKKNTASENPYILNRSHERVTLGKKKSKRARKLEPRTFDT